VSAGINAQDGVDDLPEDFSASSFGQTSEEHEPSGKVLSMEEPFSLYGYLVNFFQTGISYKDNEFGKAHVGDAMIFRLKGDWNPEANLKFHTEMSYIMQLGSLNPYIMMQKLGAVQFSQQDYPTENFNHQFILDHVWGMVTAGPFDLQFGKFPLAWGTGYIFNPTARLVIPPFLEVISEETPGILAVYPSIAIGDNVSLEAYASFQERSMKYTAFKEDSDFNNLPWAIRLKAIAGSFDLSLSWIKEVQYMELDLRPYTQIFADTAAALYDDMMLQQTIITNDQAVGIAAAMNYLAVSMSKELPVSQNYHKAYYLGFDFIGGIWDIEVYGEAALRFPMNEEYTKIDLQDFRFERELEAIAGAKYTIPGIETDLRLEYYYQGKGAAKKEDYNIMLSLAGERMVQGRNYLTCVLDKKINDQFSLLGVGFINLQDGSFACIPETSFSPYNNFQISLGAMILYGEHGTEFDGRYTIMGQEIDLTDTIDIFIRMKLSF
jgi:hypothetical protein